MGSESATDVYRITVLLFALITLDIVPRSRATSLSYVTDGKIQSKYYFLIIVVRQKQKPSPTT